MQMIRSKSIFRAVIAGVAVAALPVFLQAQHYQQTNLVSDGAGAKIKDMHLVNPWGLSRGSGSPWWVSDNGTGLSTLYLGTGSPQPLVVTIPPADSSGGATGTPTGTVFNGGPDFEIASGSPAVFLFVTEDGTVSGWNPKVNLTKAVIKVNQKNASVFKGATIAQAEFNAGRPRQYLYVADFRQSRVQVYDTSYSSIHLPERSFRDPELPAGYAPFNVQNIGGEIYVTYAVQDSAKHDEVDGDGLGYVDIFSPTGGLLRRLQHGPWFNAPWGLTLASGDFGIFSHSLLVGQFGSGTILVFDPVNGHFRGWLRDKNGSVIRNEGLWGLSFGNGTNAGPANTLFFSAGSNHEQDGLFGSITAIENPYGNDR